MAILIIYGGVKLYPTFDGYWGMFGSTFLNFMSPHLDGLRTDPLIDLLCSRFSSYAPPVFHFTGILLFGYIIFRVLAVIFSRAFQFLYFI